MKQKFHPGTKVPIRNLEKLAARHQARIQARRGEKAPKGYAVRYEASGSDYGTSRRKVFVRKKS